MDAAIAAVESCFKLIADGGVENFARQRGGSDGVLLNVMWAIAPALAVMGVKTYPVVRTDVPQASTSTVVLYGLPEGRVAGILEAEVLGQRRTGATTAVATRCMARPDAKTAAIFGAGWQAYAQVHGLVAVLPDLERVMVVGRSRARLDAFVSALDAALPVEVAISDAERAVRQADVIVTATGASEPLFRGEWLRPGTHINAVGSNRRDKREIDQTTLDRAAVIAVDAMDVARSESGDLIMNSIDWTSVIELAPVVAGTSEGRWSDQDITIFESHGLAAQDVACAYEVLALARAAGLGVPLDLPALVARDPSLDGQTPEVVPSPSVRLGVRDSGVSEPREIIQEEQVKE